MSLAAYPSPAASSYIADTNNNAIRVLDSAKWCNVSTLQS